LPDWTLWIITPLLAGIIGWFTNWLAVKMLFRPRVSQRILGFTFQGVIPKRRSDIAQVIGKTIEQELLTHGDLQEALKKVDAKEALRPILQEKIDLLVKEKIASINPMLMALMPKELLEKIKKAMLEEILNALPQIIEKLGDSFIKSLPISELVIQNINKFDLERLEKMIVDAANKEFKFIEYLGAVVGVLIGLLQMTIMTLY
jgi:uncharacterized membrane protein YheB (UPF0754 family)